MGGAVRPTSSNLQFYTNNLGSQLWVFDPRSTPSWFNAATGKYTTQKPSGLSTFNLQGPITQDQSNIFPYLSKYVTGVPAPTRLTTPTTTSQVYGPPTPTGFKPGPSATSTISRVDMLFNYLVNGGDITTAQMALGQKTPFTSTEITSALQKLTAFKQAGGFNPPTPGPGFAPTPYAQTERGMVEQRAWEADQARLAREAAAAEAERNRLEQLRQSRFSALQGIVDRFIAEQGQASRLVAGLGPDQFKMASALQGLPVLGTTPQAGFAQAQTEFASRPVPNVSAQAPISEIENAIAAIGGIKPPSLPVSGFGMALGGTLPGMVPEMMPPQPGMMPPMPEQPPGMMPGQEMMQMGPPAAPGAPQFGTTKTAVLIGEGNLQVEPGTEVAITDTATGTTEIIPLTGQAATGASIFSPGYGGFAQRPPGTLFDPMSGVAAISPLYAGMGLPSFPMANQNQSLATLGRLGAQPSLIRESGTSPVYYRDPATGAYRHVANPDVFNQSGFKWGDISVIGGGMSGLPMGPQLTSPTLFPPGTGSESFSQKLGKPLVEPMTGAILPTPQANAFKLAQLAARNAGLFELALQAYESAGLTRQSVLSSLTNVLITGRDQGTGIGLR